MEYESLSVSFSRPPQLLNSPGISLPELKREEWPDDEEGADSRTILTPRNTGVGTGTSWDIHKQNLEKQRRCNSCSKEWNFLAVVPEIFTCVDALFIPLLSHGVNLILAHTILVNSINESAIIINLREIKISCSSQYAISCVAFLNSLQWFSCSVPGGILLLGLSIGFVNLSGYIVFSLMS